MRERKKGSKRKGKDAKSKGGSSDLWEETLNPGVVKGADFCVCVAHWFPGECAGIVTRSQSGPCFTEFTDQNTEETFDMKKTASINGPLLQGAYRAVCLYTFRDLLSHR